MQENGTRLPMWPASPGLLTSRRCQFRFLEKPMEKNILVISFSPLHSDPRVYRQIKFLSEHTRLNISAAGFTAPQVNGLRFFKISTPKPKRWSSLLTAALKLKLGLYESYYWNQESVLSAKSALADECFEMILANDIHSLPLAIYLSQKNNAKIILDCHEYTPREYDDQFRFSFFLKSYLDYIYRIYLPKTHRRITVCQGIAEEYHKNYGGHWEVITNAPFYENFFPSPVEENCIQMIHHGGLNPSRNAEKMIELMDHLDQRFQLEFMFVNTYPNYLKRLKYLARKNPRIRFRDPVDMHAIVRTINHYDIGLYLLSPAGFNNRMALPNKFFEFIQARLAPAIWPSPEMTKVINKYNCGVVSEEYSVESMAEALSNLTVEDIVRLKTNSHKASEELCAEKNKESFLNAIQSL
jgi:hypothetical protein